MTIPATPRRSPVYVGNGTATDYAFAFKVTDPATLAVTVADANDLNSQVLVNGVDYTVTLNGDQSASPGGSISYAGLPVGHRLVITSDTDSSQPTAISNLGAFHANVLEDALDRLAILHQQQQERLNRTLQVPITSEIDPTAYLRNSLDTAANSASAAADSAAAAALIPGPSGSANVGFLQSGAGAVARTAQDKLREVVSVKDFGAVGDGATDDTVAIQAAIDSLTSGGGGVLLIPHGYYRVTATINVGLPVFTGYSFITSRTSEVDDTDIAANRISANTTANLALANIDIIFNAGAFIVADFSPVTPTPVLAYNLAGAYSAGHGSIVGASIISPAMLTGGKYAIGAVSVPQTNKLIGVFIQSGCKRLEKTFASGLEFGVVSVNPFWVRISDFYAYWIGGDCMNLAQANAITVDNLVMWESNRGLVFDGAASAVRGIHTEQVAEDITIFGSDCCEFGPAYLEDISTDDGTGKYAVRLGYVENGLKILHTKFTGLRNGSTRPNKGAFRIWDAAASVLDRCRAYGQLVVADANSNGIIHGGDFDIETIKWSKLDKGRIGLFKSPGTPSAIKALWHKNGFSIGGPYTVPANSFLSVDLAFPGAGFDGKQTVTATPTSGIDNNLLWVARVGGADTVRIRFYNPTGSSISLSGNMAISITQGA